MLILICFLIQNDPKKKKKRIINIMFNVYLLQILSTIFVNSIF